MFRVWYIILSKHVLLKFESVNKLNYISDMSGKWKGFVVLLSWQIAINSFTKWNNFEYFSL